MLPPFSMLCLPLAFLLLQGADYTLTQISEALQKGDAARLSSFFAPQVEIYLGTESRIYSSTQGRYVMKDFFQNNPPRSFMLLHKGRSDDLLYAIGSYVSQGGRWDVSFFTRFQKGKYVIEQIRFEPVAN